MYLPFATDGSEGSDLLLSFEYSWFKGRDFEGREEEFEGSMDSLCNINFFKRCSSSMRCLKFMKVKKKEGKGFSIFGISLSFHLFTFDIKKTVLQFETNLHTSFLVKSFSHLFIFSLLSDRR